MTQTRATGRPAAAGESTAVTGLTDLFVKAVRALGTAGRPVEASRLAAKAWWVLGEEYARQAERVNGTMHYLARLPEETDPTAAHRTELDPDTTDRDTTDQ